MTRLTIGCLAAALAAVAVVRMIPSTGWIVAEHFRQQSRGSMDGLRALRDFGVIDFPAAPSYRTDPLRDRLAEGARRAPDDFSTVYTACTWRASVFDAAKEAPLRELSLRFPGRADLRAHTLRLATLYSVHIVRPETDMPEEASRFGRGLEYRMTPEIANFLGDARAGQKLDPGNAFFPLMEAVGHLAAGQDEAAVRAMEEAAACNRFDDYTAAEAEVFLKAIDRWDGRRGVIARASAGTAVRFPHLNQIRLATRALSGIASRREALGDLAASLRIREYLLRVGRLMRTRSSGFLFTQIAGSNMARVAIAGRSVRSSARREADGTAALERSDQLARFEAFARSGKRSDLVTLAQSEIAASQDLAKLVREGRSPQSGLREYGELASLWNAGSVLLALIVVGTIAAGAGLLLFRDGDPRGRLRGLSVISIVVLLWLGWQHTVACVARSVSFQVMGATAGLGSVNAARLGANVSSYEVAFPVWLALAGMPALVTAVAWLLARRLKTGFPDALCANCAFAAAILTVAVYPFVLQRTQRLEARIQAEHIKLQQHQGRYLASVQGLRWPD